MELAGIAIANRIELTLRFVATNFSGSKAPEFTDFAKRGEYYERNNEWFTTRGTGSAHE